MNIAQHLPQHISRTECNTPQYPPLQPKFKDQLKIDEKQKRKQSRTQKTSAKSVHKQKNALARYSQQNLNTTVPYSSVNTFTLQSEQNLQQNLEQEQQRQKLKERYPNPTGLMEPGVSQLRNMQSQQQMNQQQIDEQKEEDDLKERDYYQWKVKYSNRPKTAIQGKNLKMSMAFSEYEYQDNFEDPLVQPDKSPNPEFDNYEEQLTKFKNMVFDKQGHFKYHKVDKFNKEQQQKMEHIFNKKRISTKPTFMASQNQEGNMQKKFKPGEKIQKIVKSAQEKATMHPRKQVLQEIKEKSLKTLKQMMHINVKEKLIDASKNEVIRAQGEMNNEVDKLQREIDVLKSELEKSKDTIVELRNGSERQNEKNHLLTSDLDDMKKKFDDLKKNVQNIEQFIPEYTVLNEKFPGFTASKVIQQYKKMEDHITEQRHIIYKLEEEQIKQDKYIQGMRQNFELNNAEMLQKELQRQKQTELEIQSYKEKNLELESALQYKEKYIEVSKNIMLLYNKWSKNITVFPLQSKDGGPIANIDNPRQILNIMDRQISISSNELLQSYLRKIIVSANQLQRQFLPENVNNSFDADIIYQKILKLLHKMDVRIKKLDNENVKLRKICGLTETIADDNEIEQNDQSNIMQDLSYCKEKPQPKTQNNNLFQTTTLNNNNNKSFTKTIKNK